MNENAIDETLIDDILQLSPASMFDQLEPFFDFLSKSKQVKLVKIFLEHFTIDQQWFITNEDRLELLVQAVMDIHLS